MGVITTSLIHLIFNYQPGLVSLELIQNIRKGKKAPRVSWRYFNKQKDRKIKNRVKLLKLSK